MFSKVLIANRGEIAVRIIRACEELGVTTVAVYSELDRDAPHVQRAGEAFLLGPGPASESYLSIEKLLDAVQRSGAEAVHPGYGFLAENAAFAAALAERGITFIGPPASAIEAMGSKTRARELMAQAGVPIVPGTTEPVETLEDARKLIEETIGYPVAVKAAGGGGGKGFRVALSEDKLKDAFEGAAREGEKFFSDATVYLERYLPDPRHVEVQVLADTPRQRDPPGRARLLDPAPPPEADRGVPRAGGRRGVARPDRQDRHRGGGGRRLHRRRNDRGPAGHRRGRRKAEYFFLEMNTRVQVEHCVTEMVTGIDIVKEGIRVAAGEPLSVVPGRRRAPRARDRVPDQRRGRQQELRPGAGHDRRVPRACGARRARRLRRRAGSEISPMYDPMVAKLIVWDVDREQATKRMLRALGEYRDRGPEDVDAVPPGAPADAPMGRCRDLPGPDRGPRVAQDARRRPPAPKPPEEGEAGETVEHGYTVEVSGKRFEVKVIGPPFGGVRRERQRRRRRGRRRPRAPRRERALGRRRRRRRRHAALAAAGQRAQGRGRAGRGRRGGRAGLHHRGDEDGERDHRPQGGHGRRAADR